jgi:hypothetical protein
MMNKENRVNRNSVGGKKLGLKPSKEQPKLESAKYFKDLIEEAKNKNENEIPIWKK